MLLEAGDFLLVIHPRISNTKLERSANAQVVKFLAEGANAAQFERNTRSPFSADLSDPQENCQASRSTAARGLCKLDLQNYRVYDIA
jgi:hypothetical protein